MAGNSSLFQARCVEKFKREHVHWFSPNLLVFSQFHIPPPRLEHTGHIHLLSCHQTPAALTSTGAWHFWSESILQELQPFYATGRHGPHPFLHLVPTETGPCSLGNRSNYCIIVYKKNMKTNGTIAVILQGACPAQASQRRAGFVHGRELLASHPYQK